MINGPASHVGEPTVSITAPGLRRDTGGRVEEHPSPPDMGLGVLLLGPSGGIPIRHNDGGSLSLEAPHATLAGSDRGRVHCLWLNRGARPACDPRTVVGSAFDRLFMRNRRHGGFHAHPHGSPIPDVHPWLVAGLRHVPRRETD